MRIPIIAGNWKMYKTSAEALDFIEKIKEPLKGTEVEIVLCVPYTLLAPIKEAVKGTNIKVAAQNVHWEEQGAFTGEISPLMLKDIGVDYCVIGHSERRQLFNETDETVNNKAFSVLKHGIKPIVCVGETLKQRENGETERLIRSQVMNALKGIDSDEVKKVVIAYEPIWAIGTGKTATAQQANQVAFRIRETLRELYGEDICSEVRIQYGGSVKPGNIEEIMDQEDIDGALVGGASLNANDFIQIVNF